MEEKWPLTNKRGRRKKILSFTFKLTILRHSFRVDSMFKVVTARLKSFNITISYQLLLQFVIK